MAAGKLDISMRCFLVTQSDDGSLQRQVTTRPLDELPESASDAEKQTAIRGWRAKARRDWGSWYLRVRPYAERGDEFEARLRERIGTP